MTTNPSTSIASSVDQARLLPLVMSGFLGLFIISFVGFSQLDVMHNAGHDYRHSMAFPCH